MISNELNQFLKLVQNYLAVLIEGKKTELDEHSIKLYDHHIKAVEDLLKSINTEKDFKNLLESFFESEGRAFGWSYLPNPNGEKAESTFWNLKQQFHYFIQ